ncbi:MAG: hypothetical protein HY674_04220 [Chloroflexi bacterium]|nr:hypothetical protein [Chloroflexota bacterium]
MMTRVKHVRPRQRESPLSRLKEIAPLGNVALLLVTLAAPDAFGSTNQLRYYAHPAVHDGRGVIAPWYQGLNGQCDFRVRIAAETLKRYPWTTRTNAIAEYPAYVFSGFWQISSNGIIRPRDPGDWGNGDLSQRATSLLNGFVDYYRYTGDAAAVAHVTYLADYLVEHGVTAADHPWPGMFVSVPVKGKAFWKCNPRGMMQLDLCASTGQGLLRAYQLAGKTRWFETAQHWGDLLAAHCNLDPQADPWPRYANPETVPWNDNKQTSGVTMILAFPDELIRLGYTGQNNHLLAARDAGRRYLRDRLLPAWAANDTWGRYFWDRANPVQNCLTTPDAARYVLEHPDSFDNWRNSNIGIESVQYSAASGVANFPSGTGPRETQRMVFGYTGRADLRDSRGCAWRPATEFVTRIGEGKDSVAECWRTAPAAEPIAGTPDPELYRSGVHGRDFWVNLTVGPGCYHARLKFAATRGLDSRKNCFDITINGRRVVERLDVAATAGGPNRAVDLVFNDIAPANGVIEVRFTASRTIDGDAARLGEAFVQALEVGRGNGGKGAQPVSAAALTDRFDYLENSWSVIGLKDQAVGHAAPDRQRPACGVRLTDRTREVPELDSRKGDQSRQLLETSPCATGLFPLFKLRIHRTQV